jgi:hypothetical protein
MTTYSRPERLTDRDREVLRFAVEMFGLPLKVLAEMVPGDRVARRIVDRLELARLVRTHRVVGQTWIVPTARGMDEVDLHYSLWKPAGWKLEHHATVIRLRLHLEHAYPSARWESERAIRRRFLHDAKKTGVSGKGRRADGALHWEDGTATGIEVELSVKSRRKPGLVSGTDRYVDIVRDSDPAWRAGVWWFTPARHVDRLSRRLVEAGGGDVHQVYPLPPEVAP